MTQDVPTIPLITAVVRSDTTGELTVDGETEAIRADESATVSEEILNRVTALAGALGRPVRLTTDDDRGSWPLIVHPDGDVKSGGEPLLKPVPDPDTTPAPQPERDSQPSTRPVPVLTAAPAAASAPPSRRDARVSFLDEESRPKPASRGWRGLIAKSGIRVPPSAKESAERTDIHAVSQHWPGPRTIAVVNGKGGANKTPTTAMLSAVFARNGGAGVLAWDNNETRGTLGWRTEQGQHTATVQSLLPNTEALLSPGARAADLSQFVHHQTGDKYDVLRSNPTMLATEQRIAAEDFDRLHAVVTKYFRLILVDSGNDESAERWLRMIDHTDQLVIATTALGEHAEAGALLLEALAQRDEHSARLAAGAVVIVSQSEKSSSLAAARGVADGFGSLARVAVSVPFDRAMHGGKLRYDDLAPATRRAWLRAAAAVAEGL
jgi:MinD-like ATPase involved in chromosome partitioning or flagellar assembly